MTFLSRMWAITRGHRGLLSIAVLGSVLYTALSVLPALIIRQILTVLTQPSPTGLILDDQDIEFAPFEMITSGALK